MPITELDIKKYRIDDVDSTRVYDFEVLNADRKLLKLIGVTIRFTIHESAGADVLP